MQVASHPRCNYTGPTGEEPCCKFAQFQISYVLNRTLLQYRYCPPHKKLVEKDLYKLRIEFAVLEIAINDRQRTMEIL